jgi:ATP-dependent Lon protease
MKPILLVGPAGTGKTRLARRIAEAGGVPMRTLPCGASTDARMLIGTARGWHSAQPCFPLVAMARSGCANPVIYVDELDKGARGSPNGSVAAGLLPYLEAETAARWTDECLLALANVTTVNWIASANDLKPIPSALVSRFSVIQVPAPPADAFDGALRQVLSDIAADYEVPEDGLPEIEPELVAALRAGFAKGQISLRRLRDQAESALGSLLLQRPRN